MEQKIRQKIEPDRRRKQSNRCLSTRSSFCLSPIKRQITKLFHKNRRLTETLIGENEKTYSIIIINSIGLSTGKRIYSHRHKTYTHKTISFFWFFSVTRCVDGRVKLIGFKNGKLHKIVILFVLLSFTFLFFVDVLLLLFILLRLAFGLTL